VDYLTGYEVSFSVFYLVPIILVSWIRGLRQGVVISVACAVAWFLVDLASGHPYPNPYIPAWNAGVRFAFFLGFAYLVSKRRAWVTELEAGVQQRTEELRDVNERLRLGLARRERSEAALREGEERFRSLFENAAIGIYQSTPDGRILAANPTLVRMLGFNSFQELAERNLQRNGFDPNSPRSAFREQVEREGQVMGLEAAWTRPDGSVISVRESARAVRADDGRVLYYEGTVEDITERKRAEEARAYLASIVESSDDAIIGERLDGTIVSWNAGAAALYGYSADEVIGRSVSILAPPDKTEEIPSLLERLSRGEAIAHLETLRVRKDGRQVQVSLTVSPIRDAAGNITGVSAIARDISERKRLEVQLLQAQKMEAVGRLAGGIAHDFNNLLTVIIGYSQLLLEKLGANDALRGNVEAIDQAGGRAAALTRQLLAFSRRQVLAPQVLDLNAVVAHTEQMLRRLIGEDIELGVVKGKGLGRVKADPGQIEQVILNLAVNARDAMPGGERSPLRHPMSSWTKPIPETTSQSRRDPM
jgi:PAS domain S-box-containing protein